MQDSEPRIISNLIVDQSANNPAAVDAAGPGAEPDPASGSFFIPNATPDGGLSAPYNSLFTLFGQFFDHGLDLVGKSGTESVVVPLQPDDPLYQPGAPTNFMVVSRTVLNGGTAGDEHHDSVRRPEPDLHVASVAPGVPARVRRLVAGEPVATGRLADGAIAGNIANWTETKANAASMLGIQLVDTDVLNVPLLLTDEYGRFLRGPNGFPQMVTRPVAVPVEGNPLRWRPDRRPLTDVVRTGPRVPRRHRAQRGADRAPATTPALLGAHFITGDGRGNENIGLTAIHSVFHSEHNRVAEDIDAMLDRHSGRGTAERLPAAPAGWGYGERLFQAAKFVTEMEYQHLVFEEFGRKVQPAIRVFAAYDETLNGSIVSEFAHAVYRFGHSMLTESVDRVNANGTRNDISLLNAFLNPAEFNDGGPAGQLTNAAGSGRHRPRDERAGRQRARRVRHRRAAQQPARPSARPRIDQHGARS